MRINLSGDVFIDKGFDCFGGGNIFFGKKVSLGHNNKIWAFDKITIEDYVQTALGVTFIAGSHENESFKAKKEQQIIVGAGTWIGANATILGGVTIGKGCIVGAGSLVNKSFPDFSIVGGVPAKIIKRRTPAAQIHQTFGIYNLEDI